MGVPCRKLNCLLRIFSRVMKDSWLNALPTHFGATRLDYIVHQGIRPLTVSVPKWQYLGSTTTFSNSWTFKTLHWNQLNEQIFWFSLQNYEMNTALGILVILCKIWISLQVLYHQVVMLWSNFLASEIERKK